MFTKNLRRTVVLVFGLVLGFVLVGVLVFGLLGVLLGVLEYEPEYDYDQEGLLKYVLEQVLELGFLGVLVGVVLLLLVFGLGPAAHLAWLERVWVLRGRSVRFIPLFKAALERQVLRQAGAVYQFRHAALQDLLASRGQKRVAGEDGEEQDSGRSAMARCPAHHV